MGESGRLSQPEIDRLVREAEQHQAKDAAHRERVGAKTQMENYVYSLRNTIDDPKLEGKIPDNDKKQIKEVLDDAIKWLDEHQTSEKEEYEAKRKQVEAILNPLMQKMHQTPSSFSSTSAPSANEGPS